MKFNTIDSLLKNNIISLSQYHLFVVCNIKALNSSETQGVFNMDTEYFSDDEFEQLAEMFGKVDIPIDFFTYEDEFFHYLLNNKDLNTSKLIVYNAAQSGTGAGRKSLIPAFCNLHHLIHTGSNAYVVSLCRNKYHVNKLLAQAGVPVPQTWIYSGAEWLLKEKPVENMRMILKPIYESASIGIDMNSVQIYTPALDQILQEREKQQRQPIIAQEFISGYEVEVPLVCVNGTIYPLRQVGISIDQHRRLDDNILDYERIYYDQYEFYDFTEECTFTNELEYCAAKAVLLLGMEGLCRVDFRITPKGNYFITDVSTNPHFIAHSSVGFSFQNMGYEPKDIAQCILMAAIMKGQ